MIYKVYTDQHYQGRKIPLLVVFIIVKKDNKNKAIMDECDIERYVIITDINKS